MSVTKVLVHTSRLERPEPALARLRQELTRLPGAFELSSLCVRPEAPPPGDDPRLVDGCPRVLVFTPLEAGYGHCLKLAIRYAVRNDYDVLVDLQDPEPAAAASVPDLIAPILASEAEASFGSSLVGATAGRPAGARCPSSRLVNLLHRALLGSATPDFLPPLRAWSVRALAALPYERNADDHAFDTQLFVQAQLGGLRLAGLRLELERALRRRCPGVRGAWRMIRCCLQYRLHRLSIFYQREFDLDPDSHYYEPKLGYRSSHTMAIERVPHGARVLDLGCNEGEVARELKRKGCHVVGIDFLPVRDNASFDVFVSQDLDELRSLAGLGSFDHVFLLDVIEHLDRPEEFLERLRGLLGADRPLFVVTTANVAFAVTRFQLLFSSFNYGKQGILDLTHKRLFTFGSLARAFRQAGYEVTKLRGIPAPFPKAFGLNPLARLLLAVNVLLIGVSRTLFSYQVYLEARPTPSLDEILRRSAGAAAAPEHPTGGAPLPRR